MHNHKPKPQNEQDAILKELINRDYWIIDGAQGKKFRQRLEAANLIIYLDRPQLQSILRVFKRNVQNGVNRGQPWGKFYWNKKWEWKKQLHPKICAFTKTLQPTQHYVVLQSDQDIAKFLKTLTGKD